MNARRKVAPVTLALLGGVAALGLSLLTPAVRHLQWAVVVRYSPAALLFGVAGIAALVAALVMMRSLLAGGIVTILALGVGTWGALTRGWPRIAQVEDVHRSWTLAAVPLLAAAVLALSRAGRERRRSAAGR